MVWVVDVVDVNVADVVDVDVADDVGHDSCDICYTSLIM